MVGNPCPRFHTLSPGSFSPPTGTMCQLWRRCITTRHTLVVRLALNTLLCVVVSLWGHGSQQAIPRVKVQREHGALASSPAISAHFSVWGAQEVIPWRSRSLRFTRTLRAPLGGCLLKMEAVRDAGLPLPHSLITLEFGCGYRLPSLQVVPVSSHGFLILTGLVFAFKGPPFLCVDFLAILHTPGGIRGTLVKLALVRKWLPLTKWIQTLKEKWSSCQ